MILPAGFVDSTASLFDGLAETLVSTEPSVSVRPNAAKGFCLDGGRPVPWLRAARYLDVRPVFTLDPQFHQGLYYVQDASSMFIAHVLRQIAGDAPLAYLDACAAPGGKTTAAIDALPPGSLVVANEAVPARAAVLRENIVKWGAPGVIVTRGDARAFGVAGPEFDIVAADVPCSGEGMMRKDPEAVAQWSPGLVAQCAARQREIVASLWRCLRPGGLFVYSTCTFNRQENEDVVAMMVHELDAEPVAIAVDPGWGITASLDPAVPACRFIPGRVEGEGLFMAVLRKPGEAASSSRRRHGSVVTPSAQVASWVRADAGPFTCTNATDRINLFPHAHADILARLEKLRAVDVIHHGIVVATVKGRDLIPAHQLAMSTALAPDAFPTVDIDRGLALSYLRGEAVAVDAPRGFVLLTYLGRPLGFVKNLGNRSNNLYPRDYRIRHL